jgi:hypothetical protein
MSEELVKNSDEFAKTITELLDRIKTLTEERDEARRKYCYTMASYSSLGFTNPKWFADEEEWDCFKDYK